MQNLSKSPIRAKGQARAEFVHGQRSRVDIRELVGPGRQVTISHAGADYVLRITRNGKLILTK